MVAKLGTTLAVGSGRAPAAFGFRIPAFGPGLFPRAPHPGSAARRRDGLFPGGEPVSAPYLPQRYLLFSLPLVVNVILATGAAGVLRRRSESKWRFRRFVAPAVGLLCLALLGGRGSRREGLER